MNRLACTSSVDSLRTHFVAPYSTQDENELRQSIDSSRDSPRVRDIGGRVPISQAFQQVRSMLDLYKEIIVGQYEAALSMLGSAVRQCPVERWDEPVANLKFCQAAFHTVFFTDVYLGPNLAALKEQPFHAEHAAEFGDYEEFEKRPQQTTYTKEFVLEYLDFCHDKMRQVMAGETEASLQRRPGFDWQQFSRAELHVYNIRHIHHHAAQLSLRLRLDTGEGVKWVRSGWEK